MRAYQIISGKTPPISPSIVSQGQRRPATVACLILSTIALVLFSKFMVSPLGNVPAQRGKDAHAIEMWNPAKAGADCGVKDIDSIPICTDKEACICIVDAFFSRQPWGQLDLLQTRSKSLGGGPCGDEFCKLPPVHERCDTYDNAVAAIYFVKRGKLDFARRILNGFIRLLYPTNLAGMDPKVLYTNLGSGRTLTLLAAAYSVGEKAGPGQYMGDAVVDGAVDTGNNAWAALAFVHFAATTGEACYSLVARDILQALRQHDQCSDALQGFNARRHPYAKNYRVTEHNVDVFAVAHLLESAEEENMAASFVKSMYGRNPVFPTSYSMGTGNAVHCDTGQPTAPVPADGTFWSLLADVDPDEQRMTAALQFALRDCCATAQKSESGFWEQDADLLWQAGVKPLLNGTRFSTWGHGVQWEITAGAVMAMIHYKNKYGDGSSFQLSRYISEARKSLKHILAMYGGVPATILGGNFNAFHRHDHHAPYPGGSDTGISFTYLRYLHVASTAWLGLLLLYNADDWQQVDNDANPFAPPSKAVPPKEPKVLTCLRNDQVR